jgi:uracil-DNA glycosylase
MNNIKNKSWQNQLKPEFQKPYFEELMQKVAQEYATTTCFPPKELIFAAFEQFDFQETKVVIIGQDPYHGTGEANGLCFSVNEGIAIPSSLKNIFTEINSEYNSILLPTSGNLERWAKQGILLLNAGLTVKKDEANSHKHLNWSIFTDAVIKLISNELDSVVFLLWGNFAQKKGKFINREKHLILESGHPSFAHSHKKWFGNNHFKLTNSYLKEKGKVEIEWF